MSTAPIATWGDPAHLAWLEDHRTQLLDFYAPEVCRAEGGYHWIGNDGHAVGLPDGWSVDHVPGPALGEASFIHPAEPPAGVIADLAEWLARCPAVDPRWRDVTRFAWWTLGVNTLVLDAPAGLNRAVVPSKIGYVGLWQWDAYFMAIGLRHGDPGLAREQLRIALAHPSTSGQLPDVVHEDGILASSDDLPPPGRPRESPCDGLPQPRPHRRPPHQAAAHGAGRGPHG